MSHVVKNSRGINPLPCCQCSSRRLKPRKTAHSAAIHPPTHNRQNHNHTHTSENHKSPSWICKLIAVEKQSTCLNLFPLSSVFAYLSVEASFHYVLEAFCWACFLIVAVDKGILTENRWAQTTCRLFGLLVFVNRLCGGWKKQQQQKKKSASNGFSCFSLFFKKSPQSGQSAGEALRSLWLTWQPWWITLLVKAHSRPSKVASFPPPVSCECADYAIQQLLTVEL